PSMTAVKEQVLESGKALAAPISEAAPTGQDASYEPTFEQIKGEIDKLTSVTGEPVDWRLVVSGGTELTKTVTKDVRVLSWLALARLHVEGVRGLAEALSGFQQVCASVW